MGALFKELGINGAALLAHGLNFLIVLTVLTFVVYRPLMRLMDERRRTIEKGLADARSAGEALARAETLKSERLAEADAAAATIVEEAERAGRVRGDQVVAEAEGQAERVVAEAKERAARERAQSLASVERAGADFVRQLFEKTVGLNPSAVDEALIRKAAEALAREHA